MHCLCRNILPQTHMGYTDQKKGWGGNGTNEYAIEERDREISHHLGYVCSIHILYQYKEECKTQYYLEPMF